MWIKEWSVTYHMPLHAIFQWQCDFSWSDSTMISSITDVQRIHVLINPKLFCLKQNVNLRYINSFEFSLVLTCDIIFYGEVTPVSVVPDQLIDLLSWLVGYFKVIHAHYSVTFLYNSTSVIICILYNLKNFFFYVNVI